MSVAPEPVGSSTIDVVEMTAEQLQAGFASRAFTSEALTKVFVDDIIPRDHGQRDQHRRLQAVTVPAGHCASVAPFNLIVVGPMWSEAALIGIADASEQATRHRKPPMLSRP